MRHCCEHKHGETSLAALAAALLIALLATALLIALLANDLTRAFSRALAMVLPWIKLAHLPLPLCSRIATVTGDTVPRSLGARTWL